MRRVTCCAGRPFAPIDRAPSPVAIAALLVFIAVAVVLAAPVVLLHRLVRAA